MVETGASNGEMEDVPVLAGNELQADGFMKDNNHGKTEMVRLIIQSLQHLGYGYEYNFYVLLEYYFKYYLLHNFIYYYTLLLFFILMKFILSTMINVDRCYDVA